jgi:hypothetical protein
MVVCCVLRLAALAAFILSVPFQGPARAQDLPDALGFLGKLEPPPGRFETSSGADVTDTAWSGYSAAVIAPFRPLDQDGLRLKLFGSASAWSYERKRVYCALSAEEKKKATGTNFSKLCNDIANRPLTGEERKEVADTIAPFGLHLEGDQIYHQQAHKVMRYDFAVMPGYQVTWHSLTLKAYLGPAMETRDVLPGDYEKALDGAYWGAKTALESWLAITDAFWLSGDASYFTGTEAYSISLRPGYQVTSWLALGPEAAAFGDQEDDSARAGGFLRFAIGKVEATISGGVSGNYDGGTGVYGSAGVYTKF